MLYLIIGGIIGFIIFLIELESPDLGNIIFRIDATGKKSISYSSIFEMMKSPFIYSQFWTNNNFWKANWIITSLTGIGIGYIYEQVL